MNEPHELHSRIEEEKSDKRRRIFFYIFIAAIFITLFVVSIDYAVQGPKVSQINSHESSPQKTTDGDRFGFTHSWINPIFRKSSE